MSEEVQEKQRERSKHRSISKRVVVTGDLELTRPAHFGNGDEAELTDMPLLLDEPLLGDAANPEAEFYGWRALLPGASLAGALRNYLREREWGYEVITPTLDPQQEGIAAWQAAENSLLAAQLFGAHRGTPDGDQSPLIVDDAFCTTAGLPEIELRDGVKLDAKTRTAEEKKKYDYQLLTAETKFQLRFELLLDDDEAANGRRRQALALALRGLGGYRTDDGAWQGGEIRLGARKRRGFGRCRVTQWNLTEYDLKGSRADVFAWLAADYQKQDGWQVEHAPLVKSGSDIFALLGVAAAEAKPDRREDFRIEAVFEIDGSLMIRAGGSEQQRGPDDVHLQTKPFDGKELRPILSGTSLAGALRQRALRIAKTLATSKGSAAQLVDRMFGPERIDTNSKNFASRVLVEEEFVEGGAYLVQTRIKLDRFTGGTIEGALLEEAPIFGGTLKLNIALRKPAPAEMGLLLLVLKDLWLGDLPLGGEASIGRGRLKGGSATIRHSGSSDIVMTETHVKPADVDAAAKLEGYLAELKQTLVEGA